jgi:hypothetical protein
MSEKQNQMRCPIAALLLATLLALSTAAVGQEPKVLSLHSRIPLKNVQGRIDHSSVDVKGQRLFVAAVANHTLEVIDLQAGKQVRSITELAEPQGVFYDTSTNRLFVACALDVPDKQEIEVVDGVSRKVIARWPVISAKDNSPMALDEAHHRLFVGTRTPPRLLVFDTDKGKEIASSEL